MTALVLPLSAKNDGSRHQINHRRLFLATEHPLTVGQNDVRDDIEMGGKGTRQHPTKNTSRASIHRTDKDFQRLLALCPSSRLTFPPQGELPLSGNRWQAARLISRVASKNVTVARLARDAQRHFSSCVFRSWRGKSIESCPPDESKTQAADGITSLGMITCALRVGESIPARKEVQSRILLAGKMAQLSTQNPSAWHFETG
jgi:hypothetical protein